MISDKVVIERGNERVTRQSNLNSTSGPDDFYLVSPGTFTHLGITETVYEINRLAEGVTYWPYMEYLVRTGRSSWSRTSH